MTVFFIVNGRSSVKHGNFSRHIDSKPNLRGYAVDVNVTLLEDTDELLVSLLRGSMTFYKTLKGPFNDPIVLDWWNDFDKVERDMLCNYEESTYLWLGFYGYKAGDSPSDYGYILSERKDDDGHFMGYLGSINGYDKYRTLIVYSQANYTRTYHKFGEQLLGGPHFQTPFTEMYKSEITGFSCQVGAPNTKTSIFFQNTTTKDLGWEVVTPRSTVVPELNFSIKELPQALVTKYSSLNLSQISFKNGSAIQFMDGYHTLQRQDWRTDWPH